MGADLIGYTLVRPAKGADKIANKQIAKIKTVLSNAKLDDKRKVSKLIELGAELSFSHDTDDMSDADFIDTMKGLVDSVDGEDMKLTGYYRDLNSRQAKIGKKQIEILFAGDMSYGDEPEGTAYNLLKTLVELGVSDAWERALSK